MGIENLEDHNCKCGDWHSLLIKFLT